MENTESNKSLFNLSFDENIKQNLKGAAIWGGFAAILSLVSAILGIIKYFVEKNRLNSYGFDGSNSMRIQQTALVGGLVSLIISLVISIFLFYYLNRFARSVKKGVDANNKLLISDGISNLNIYFKIIGVIVIIAIVVFGLLFLIGFGSNI